MPEPFADYFTEEDYRSVMNDNGSPVTNEWPALERAQSEVVERLERWAKTSWKEREGIYRGLTKVPSVELPHVPVTSVDEFLVGGEAYTAGITFAGGVVTWNDWSFGVPPPFPATIAVEITYTFGFNDADVRWAIRRPVIEASAELLRTLRRDKKFPRKVNRVSSEGTTLELDTQRGARPWPWDPRSSDDVRRYWENSRPRRFIGSG